MNCIRLKVPMVELDCLNHTFEIKESSFEVYLTQEELTQHYIRLSMEIQNLIKEGFKGDVNNVR